MFSYSYSLPIHTLTYLLTPPLSKTGLDIIDLDSLLTQPRHFRHSISWNVADVQWSPFSCRDYWVVSTANQKALIWNLHKSEESRDGAIEHTLHAHTRAITDINFSAFHPDILATCAVDGYVHAWDLRRSRRPVLTFVDWDAGATQVKWNRQDQHIIASSHDRYLRIWDDRHGAYPVKSIEAHTSKIYGVDWNRTRAGAVVTCSLDKTIKFWDYTLEGNSLERTIQCDYPVWRARHTPFPGGLLVLPQTPGDLFLYDIRENDHEAHDEFMKPADHFTHGGNGSDKSRDAARIKEFLWRSRGTVSEQGMDEREFQLVSWGDDKKLELQRVSSTTLEADVGYYKGRQASKTQNFTRKGAVYKTFRNIERGQIEKKSATISGPKGLSSSHDKNSYNLLSEEMKKMSPAKRFRSEMRGKGSTMRGKATENEGRNQISWMSGIKFNDGTGLDGRTKLSNRRLSVISPNFDTEADWDTPESLHDEIIRLHDQFSKVDFKSDMDKRSLDVRMNGPWGEGGESVYIRTKISFPDHYPGKEVPTFEVEKTTRIPRATYNKITREVAQIAENFVGQRRGCLEATICYLLGEVDLEESQSWLTPGDIMDDGLAASSSESDDDEIPAESSTLISASQELDPSTDNLLNTARRHMNVPLPRLCGARFSSTGKLVCFFPPKEDKFKSLLSSVGFGRSKADHEPSFNTFSRLALEGLPKRTVGTLIEASDHESDSSGDGSGNDTDSSDSDSSQFQQSVGLDFWRKIHSISFRKGLSTNRSNKSSGIGTGTNMGSNATRGRAVKSKNTIAMHDLSDMLPAKAELAREYALYGEGADVCEHNASVSSKHGYQDLADIWTYAGMLLQHEVPLAVLNQSHRREPILVVARDMIKRTRKALRPSSDSASDSGVDLSYNTTTKNGQPISGRVKWGYSPLAKQLIDDLFTHFSLAADCQMLAMLSCIFTEPSSSAGLPHLDVKMTQPQTPLSMKTPAFSLDYFPSDIAAWSAYSKTLYPNIPGTPSGLPVTMPLECYGSLGLSNSPWQSSDPVSSFSAGNTPPLRSGGGSIERLNDRAQAIAEVKQGLERERLQPPSQTHSLSTSPEDSRSFKRANSGIAASFAAGLKNPFMSNSGSPPTPSGALAGSGGKGERVGTKRPSPVESMVSALTPSAVTWGHTTYLESVREKGSYPTSTCDEDDKLPKQPKPVTGISVTMWNQAEFDDEGCISTPLLDTEPIKAAIYQGYRRLYAELLFAWQLPYTRLEILKFDSMPDITPMPFVPALSPPNTKANPSATPSPGTSMAIRNHPQDKSVEIAEPPKVLQQPQPFTPTDQDLGLSITAYCLKHESRLSPLPLTPSTISHPLGGAVGRCERCDATKTQLRCVICTHAVAADYVACLNCGCASHTGCAEEYFAASFDANSSILDAQGMEVGMRRLRRGSGGSPDLHYSSLSAPSYPNKVAIGGAEEHSGMLGNGTPCPAGCECECLSSASQGVVESWEVMMGAIEVMRAREAKEAARALKKSSREGSRQGSRSSSHARVVGSGVDGRAGVVQLVGGKGEGRDGQSIDGRRRMTDEWDTETGDWDTARSSIDNPAAMRPQGRKEDSASSISGSGTGIVRRLGQVRASDGLGWVRKKSSSLRNGESS